MRPFPLPPCRLLGFLAVVLLPIDIAHSFSGTSPYILQLFWLALYWITFMLTWFVDPLLQVGGVVRCCCGPLPRRLGCAVRCALPPPPGACIGFGPQ